jgi:target of rapamycin complex subunit LST8
MSISPDKTKLITGGYQEVSIYNINSDASDQQALHTLDGISKNTVSIGFHENGSWLYTAGEDKTLKIWDLKLVSNSFHFKRFGFEFCVFCFFFF